VFVKISDELGAIVSPLHLNGETGDGARLINTVITFTGASAPRPRRVKVDRTGLVFVDQTSAQRSAQLHARAAIWQACEVAVSIGLGRDDLIPEAGESVSSIATARGMSPGQYAHDLLAVEGADAAPGLTWGTGAADIDTMLAEAFQAQAASRGADITEEAENLALDVVALTAAAIDKAEEEAEQAAAKLGFSLAQLEARVGQTRTSRREARGGFRRSTSPSEEAVVAYSE